MRPYYAALYLIAALAVTAIRAAACLDDENDDEDNSVRPNAVDGSYDGENGSPTTAPPPRTFRWDETIPNKCTDLSTGQKFKIGITWYPEGCGRKTCFYSAKRNMTLIHTEMCTCKKECLAGMKCSIIKRVPVTDARYPNCCPTTRCVPEQNLLSYFKKEYWTNAFAKIQQKNDDRITARNIR